MVLWQRAPNSPNHERSMMSIDILAFSISRWTDQTRPTSISVLRTPETSGPAPAYLTFVGNARFGQSLSSWAKNLASSGARGGVHPHSLHSDMLMVCY